MRANRPEPDSIFQYASRGKEQMITPQTVSLVRALRRIFLVTTTLGDMLVYVSSLGDETRDARCRRRHVDPFFAGFVFVYIQVMGIR
jgi:hypothetical protein